MRKRVLAILLVAVLSISIVGCGKSDSGTNDNNAGSASSSGDKDSKNNSASGSKNESSNNSDSSSKNTADSSSSDSSNNTADASGTDPEMFETTIVVEGGEAEFAAAVDKFVAERYPELKKLKEQGLIGIKAEPGKDIIKLGSWDLENGEGHRDRIKDTLEWEVLKYSDDGKSALVVSKYLICEKKYDEAYSEITWENSALRTWLNSEFYDGAFSAEEKSLIQKTKVVTEDFINDKGRVKASGGSDTEDYLFLLSVSEIDAFFDAKSRNQNAFSRICGYIDGNAGNWWLRSPGDADSKVAVVSDYGQVYDYGISMSDNREKYGVRPAFWIDLTPEIIKSNALSVGGYHTLSVLDIYVEFGDWDMGKGERPEYSKDDEMNGNIEWKILDYDKVNGQVLLISRYLLQLNHNSEGMNDNRFYDIRYCLNYDFYDSAFSDNERSIINKCTNINEDAYAAAGGDVNEDYVFLLSLTELDKYFEAEKRLDKTISRICGYKDGGIDTWWLRSPGTHVDNAAYVLFDGRVSDYGDSVNHKYGVRPALWLNLNP